jgi:hypothetical protein
MSSKLTLHHFPEQMCLSKQTIHLHVAFLNIGPGNWMESGSTLEQGLLSLHLARHIERRSFFKPPFGGKTSIRGNYRIAYDRINSFSFSSTVFQGLPGLTYQPTNSTIGQDSFGTTAVQGVRARNWAAPTPTATPQALTTPPAASANFLTVSDPHMQTPTVAQWGLSIQHELLKNTVLTVSYIGNALRLPHATAQLRCLRSRQYPRPQRLLRLRTSLWPRPHLRL